MAEEKISYEQAEKEVQAWLDYKKVSERKQEAQREPINTLIEAMMDGVLSFRETDNVLVHQLKFPIGEQQDIRQLEYKPRLKVQTTQVHLQGVKTQDGDGRMLAYVAALTSKPKDVIKHLDTEDYNISQSIAVFFF